MAQMAIYIDDQLAERLEKAVKGSGKSKSKWVAEGPLPDMAYTPARCCASYLALVCSCSKR